MADVYAAVIEQYWAAGWRGILPLPYHTDQGARKLAVDWSRVAFATSS